MPGEDCYINVETARFTRSITASIDVIRYQVQCLFLIVIRKGRCCRIDHGNIRSRSSDLFGSTALAPLIEENSNLQIKKNRRRSILGLSLRNRQSANQTG